MARLSKEVKLIAIDNIIADENQPRKSFDEASIKELALSIKAVGIIQPLSVREEQNGKYVLISGERRLRASIVAGLKKVPCVEIRAQEEDLEIMALVENIQREDLNYIEEAIAYRNIIENHAYTQQELAEKIGKKQSTVSNKLRLLKLGDEVLKKLATTNLSERHARALLAIPDTTMRLDAITVIKKRDLNVKQTEEYVKKVKSEVMIHSSKRIKTIFNYKIYTNTIKQAYDTILKTGIDADYKETQYEDRVEVKIVIPIDKKQ